jgi:hypothetical protein
MAFVEKTDYNGDTVFDGSDLDISWAYIQIKKLYELELIENEASGTPMTITPDNFATKVTEQYNKNKTNGIAENVDKTPVKIPGEFVIGAPAPAPKMAFKHFLLINDPTSGTNILDSATGERNSSFAGNVWVNPTAVDASTTWFSGTNQFSIDDTGDIRSDRNWVLYIKGVCRSLNNKSIITKGSFRVHSYKVGDEMQVMVQAAAPSVDKPQKSYHAKVVKMADVENKPVEMLIVRDGLKVRFFLNGVEHITGGDQPDPIMVDRDKPVVLSGSCWKTIEKVFITEPTIDIRDLVDISGATNTDAHSYSFAHDMDITNSFYSFKQYFPDKFGNFARIMNTPYGESHQNMWEVPPSGKDVSNGYVAKSTCLKVGAYRNAEYCNLPAIDWRGDFTISFWFCGGTTYENFFRIGSEVGDKLSLQWDYRRTSTHALKLIVNGATKFVKMPSLGSGAGDKWQHLTIVKCGTLVTVFPNFAKAVSDTWDNFSVGTTDQDAWKIGIPKFYCAIKSNAFHVSHVRIIPYALVNIPHYGKNKKSSFPELQVLNVPIEPGSVS